MAKSFLSEVSLAKEWGHVINPEGQKEELALIPESSLFQPKQRSKMMTEIISFRKKSHQELIRRF